MRGVPESAEVGCDSSPLASFLSLRSSADSIPMKDDQLSLERLVHLIRVRHSHPQATSHLHTVKKPDTGKIKHYQWPSVESESSNEIRLPRLQVRPRWDEVVYRIPASESTDNVTMATVDSSETTVSYLNALSLPDLNQDSQDGKVPNSQSLSPSRQLSPLLRSRFPEVLSNNILDSCLQELPVVSPVKGASLLTERRLDAPLNPVSISQVTTSVLSSSDDQSSCHPFANSTISTDGEESPTRQRQMIPQSSVGNDSSFKQKDLEIIEKRTAVPLQQLGLGSIGLGEVNTFHCSPPRLRLSQSLPNRDRFFRPTSISDAPQVISVLPVDDTATVRPFMQSLRPAPFPVGSHIPPRFALSVSPSQNQVSNSIDGVSVTPLPLPATFGDGPIVIEIPRFKKRALNLTIVRRHGYTEISAWLCLWIFWVGGGLLGLFFDVNTIFMVIQCAAYPSSASNAREIWVFILAVYATLWFFSVIVVWLGWEVGYEFWRRWNASRPPIEPIYFSLPASVHLSLLSFAHFSFVLYIRLSPLGTPSALDAIPETAHLLFQTIPALLPLIPRSGIAVVLLIGYWSQEGSLQVASGAVDRTEERDPHFFSSSRNGALTIYARTVLLLFVGWVALRLLLALVSGLILWWYSSRPLRRFFGTSPYFQPLNTSPVHDKITCRDPSQTMSPAKSWREENEANWEWRNRARARIQDAFELCLFRSSRYGPELRSQVVAQQSQQRLSFCRIPARMSYQAEPDGEEL